MRDPLLSIALVLAACESDPSAPACDVAGEVTGGVIAGPTEQLVDADLRVRGVATHSEGRTIRRVLVAGIAATNDGFNFESWSVTLPIDTLAGLARGAGAAVTIEVAAIDACERRFELESFTLNVDPTPGVRVTSLAIARAISSGLEYIPASGAVPALLTITGNPDAAHAIVKLSASAGSFTGAPGDQVTLQGDGAAAATATVLYSASTPTSQAVLITATAKEQIAQTTVRVAGPPTLLPGSASLAPGQEVAVTVLTQGTVQACQASPAQGLSITSGGQDLMATPGGVDVNGDQLVDIRVEAAPSLTGAVSSTVSCRDPYGQASIGTYTAQP